MNFSSKPAERFMMQVIYMATEIGEIGTMFLQGFSRITRPFLKKEVVLPWVSRVSARGHGGKEFVFGKWGKCHSKELGIVASFVKPMAFLPLPIEN
jgi:hypothetical protein